MKKIKFGINIYYILCISCFFTFYINCYTCSNDCKRVVNDCVNSNNFDDGAKTYCKTNCRPNLLNQDSQKCYSCKTISNQAINYYYFENDISSTCKQISFNANRPCGSLTKLIYESKQCASSCGESLYEMGGYCYKDCTGGNREQVDSSEKKCQCAYLYYIKTDEYNLEKYYCLSQNNYCEEEGFESYDLDTKLCQTTSDCGEKKEYNFHRGGSFGSFKRCSLTCLKDEFTKGNTKECIKTCNNFIEENLTYNTKKCLTTCGNYIIGNKCVPVEYCKFINGDNLSDKKCYDTCDNYISGRKCSTSRCLDSTPYKPASDADPADNKICLRDCPYKFYIYETSVQKKCVSKTESKNCYYLKTDTGDAKNNKKCLDNCDGKYYKIGSHECIDRCEDSDFKYHKEGDNICYESCELIPDLGKNFIKNGYVCECLLYAYENGKKVCYNNEQECFGAAPNYKYKLGNECTNTCPFKVEGEPTNYLKKCFRRREECKENKYYYYNEDTCWASCPSNMYANALENNLPGENDNHYTCSSSCTAPYNKYSGHICKKNCDPGEYIDGNNCVSECNKNYVGENNECLEECNTASKFVINAENGNTKQKCVSRCADYGKYFIAGESTCRDTCPTRDNKPYFYNSINQCLDSCSVGNQKSNEKYSYIDSQLSLQPCKTSPEQFFHYQGELDLYDTCDIFDSDDHHLCSKCNINDPNKNKVFNNYCVSECPFEAPYFKEVTNFNFEKTKKGTGTIYQCIPQCTNKIILDINKCVTSCSDYKEDGNKCYLKCDPNNPNTKYFSPITNKCVSTCSTNYEISALTGNRVCKTSCSSEKKYLYSGQCLENCPNSSSGNKIGKNNVCKDTCNANDEGQFYMKIETQPSITYPIYKCLFTCPAKDYIYFMRTGPQQFECLKSCPSPNNYIIKTKENNYECRTKCLYTDDYPYFKTDSQDSLGHIKCTNKFPCDDGEYLNDGKCEDSCSQKAERRICVSACSSEYQYKKKVNTFYECRKSCNNNEYIVVPDKECFDECPSGKEYIGNNNNCLTKAQCVTAGLPYHYYLKTVSSLNIYKCVKHCPPNFPLLVLSNQECKNACPTGKYLSVEENICYDDCLSSVKYKFTLDKTSPMKCFYKCDDTTSYVFYYDSGTNYKHFQCFNACNNGDYAYEILNICTSNCASRNGINYHLYESQTNKIGNQKKFCVAQCPPDKPYLKDNICEPKCSSPKIYFVKDFMHTGEDIEKKCLNDCPSNYLYYRINSDNNRECFSTCDEGYSFPNLQTNINAIRCHPTCSIGLFKYRVIINENNKKCVKDCHQENIANKIFHRDDGNGNGGECLEVCPDYAPFYKVGEYACLSETELTGCKYIHYDSKICNDNPCPGKSALHKESGKTICLSECIPKYGEYLTPFNTCVKDCKGPELKDLLFINDIQNKNCTCQNFYYFDTSGGKNKMVCLDSLGKKKCKYLENNIYNINLFGTKECITYDKCINNIKGILSVSSDTCYDNSYKNKCSMLHNNSEYDNTYKKCNCSYKHYYKDEEREQEHICLDANGECPYDYNKYVPFTMECVKECPSGYKYLFKNKLCLKNKPTDCKDVDTTKNIVDCKNGYNYWYNTSKGDYKCDVRCPSGNVHAPFSPTSRLCLPHCNETHFPYYYDNKCYSSCANSALLDIVNGFEIPERPDESYLAKFHCDCLNPWYTASNGKKICSESKYPYSISDCKNFTSPFPTFKYMIKETMECIDHNCPPKYPFHFNNECFKDCPNDAATFYHYLKKKDNSNDECECINLWFINPKFNKSECIEIDVNECIKFNFSLKYKINDTRQCVSECPSGTVSFNYVCYNKCPENTTLNETDDTTCVCDKKLGYWYRYEKDNGTNYMRCVLEECPKENDKNISHVRKNLVEEKSQCLISCSEDDKYKYALRYICREGCPYFTDINEKNDECIFLDLNNEINITNLTLLKDAANVQAKELYEGSDKLGGYLFNRFNASLHIYPIDINNSLKNISFRSNLTYIDLGTCLQKIFSNNEKYINENFTILVAKYDLLTNTINNYSTTQISQKDNYLINKVEYELFSSNMNEKLEINESTCDPYELIISYPLTLNRFNNYVGDLNQNEYRKKFEIGKKLYLRDNNVDTFNFNNTVYKNFCRSLEIDGKDLVFEDRYKYLYPNKKILCEANCIMNNTNFELERITCLCSYKVNFELNREDEVVDIFNDPYIDLPHQNRYNYESVKCLFNFSLNETIFYNEAFYYSSIITVTQIAMIFISAFSGVKNVAGNIRHILSKLNGKKSFGKNNSKRIKFKDDNIISSTNRALNNPPKKEKNNEKYNEDIDFDDLDSEEGNNNTILEYDQGNLGENNDKEEVNYEINIKRGIKPNNDTFNDNNKNKKSSDNKNVKSEYIPPDYNFKFFKHNEKGIMKKIERSRIPFPIKPDTIYLIEIRDGIKYPEDYLNGPYFPEQNIVIVVDDKNKDVNKMAKFIKDEKLMKKKLNTTNNKTINTIKTIKNYDDNNDININNINNINNKSTISYDKISQKINVNEKIGEKSFITLKKIDANSENNGKTILDELDENNIRKSYDDDTGIFYLIRREHLFLRVNYKTYMRINHPNYFCVFLAEVFDKIYLFRTCLLLKQSDIFSAQFTLYVFCHILLLTLLCNLFTIDIIRKIWERTDFPDLRFYLLYGLIANIIIWVVYQLFSFLINFEGSIRDLTKEKHELIKKGDDDNGKNEEKYYRHYRCLMIQIKIRVSILHIFAFLLSLCCAIYLISFFSLYTGTKSKVLKIYYISIIEIVLIKLVYGAILAAFRIMSREGKLKILYTFVYILDKYIC